MWEPWERRSDVLRQAHPIDILAERSIEPVRRIQKSITLTQSRRESRLFEEEEKEFAVRSHRAELFRLCARHREYESAARRISREDSWIVMRNFVRNILSLCSGKDEFAVSLSPLLVPRVRASCEAHSHRILDPSRAVYSVYFFDCVEPINFGIRHAEEKKKTTGLYHSTM